MTRLERADKISGIVGAARHPTAHIGRAISAQQRLYILHSVECAASGIDLRECEYSKALDLGINPAGAWKGHEDRPVLLRIDDEHLVPAGDALAEGPTE